MAATNQQLIEAEQALHQLMTGTAVRVFVDQNGERIEYSPANRGALVAYIELLKRQLGVLQVSGPMRVYF